MEDGESPFQLALKCATDALLELDNQSGDKLHLANLRDGVKEKRAKRLAFNTAISRASSDQLGSESIASHDGASESDHEIGELFPGTSQLVSTVLFRLDCSARSAPSAPCAQACTGQAPSVHDPSSGRFLHCQPSCSKHRARIALRLFPQPQST